MAELRDNERIIILGTLILGGVFLFKKLGNLVPDFGAEDTVESGKVGREAISMESPWNPNFYKKGPSGQLLLTSQSANILVLAILNSVGWFKDDFSQVLGVIKQLKTQSQVSYLADKFAQYQGQDLLTWLQGDTYPSDRYSAEQVNQLIQYVKQLPKYKP